MNDGGNTRAVQRATDAQVPQLQMMGLMRVGVGADFAECAIIGHSCMM